MRTSLGYDLNLDLTHRILYDDFPNFNGNRVRMNARFKRE